MPNERTILCGGTSVVGRRADATKPLQLWMMGQRQNVTLQSDTIKVKLTDDIPSHFLDLLEIATYVYAADCAVRRGGDDVEHVGENWRRQLKFHIPVRDPEFWSQDETLRTLEGTLAFLSEDDYDFTFTKLRNAAPLRSYFPFESPNARDDKIEEVVLFSGGLDSLGGAIEESVLDFRKVALVTHKSTEKLERRRRKLCEMLVARARRKPVFFPVCIHKAKHLSAEYTQRSRSFLYAALGATIAQGYGLARIRFYENGVVSFNLPVAAQVVGAKATRTTHPRVLKGFAKLLSLVSGRRFLVENPFVWKTKAEVLEVIKSAGCAEFIRFGSSCTHTWEMTKQFTHCGTCSQCVDRRFAVLAAGLQDHDPANAYRVDLLSGERQEGESKLMISSYLETANRVAKMNSNAFFGEFGEVTRLIRHLGDSPEAAAVAIFKLHQRHAANVTRVIDEAIKANAAAIREHTLPSTSLLRMVFGSSNAHHEPILAQVDPSSHNNVFVRNGQGWTVRFAGGRDFVLTKTKGTTYLHILLSHPGIEFSIAELTARSGGNAELLSLGDAGPASDQRTISECREKALQLNEDLLEARSREDAELEQKILSEMEEIAGYIKSTTGLRGRIRKAGGTADLARIAIRTALRRTVEVIGRYDARLAAHLKSPNLKCGWTPCYDPREATVWHTGGAISRHVTPDVTNVAQQVTPSLR